VISSAQARSQGGTFEGSAPPNLFVPTKICLHVRKIKIFPPTLNNDGLLPQARFQNFVQQHGNLFSFDLILGKTNAQRVGRNERSSTKWMLGSGDTFCDEFMKKKKKFSRWG